MKRTKFLILALVALFTFESSLYVLADIFRLSQRDEIVIGAQAASQVERTQPILPDSVTQNYASKIGQKLVASSRRSDIPYRFRVVDTRTVNAFALPGGFVYINRGLIEQAETENELVGVVAHEIGHVVNRHSVEQIARARKASLAMNVAGVILSGVRGGRTLFNGAQLVTQGFFLKFSRDAEREADRTGAENMKAAGWNPRGMVTFFDKLAQKGGNGVAFFSTHPSPAERRSNISDLIANWGDAGAVDSPEFQSVKKRLLAGPKPRG